MSSASISWVKRGNLHLTLSFLGDVEQSRVEELALELRAACQGTSSFDLVCQGLGCFPSLARLRVIWAGLRDEQAELGDLQKRVASACASFSQQEDSKPFSGHITLGRVRNARNFPKEALSSEIKRAQQKIFGQWMVKEVELMCSDLSQGVPRYSILHRISLAE